MTGSDIKCKNCGFINDVQAKQCRVCGQSKESIKTNYMKNITQQDSDNLADIIWWIKGFNNALDKDKYRDLGEDHLESLRMFRMAFEESRKEPVKSKGISFEEMTAIREKEVWVAGKTGPQSYKPNVNDRNGCNILLILKELEEAEAKHSWEGYTPLKMVAVMQEESGEAMRAVLLNEDEAGSVQDIREEVIQTAAMCLRILKNLPK